MPAEAPAPVLFVNAAGMPAATLSGVARQLARAGFRLLTWELRGSPGPPGPGGVATVADHAADGIALLDAHGIDRAHVAGWCTGATAAMEICRMLGDRAMTFTAYDGAFLFGGTPSAPVGNAVFDMCGRICADQRLAGEYHEIVRPRPGKPALPDGPDDPEQVRRLTAPYRGGVDTLVRYAEAIRSMTEYDTAAAAASLTLPSLYLAHRDDRMVSHRLSLRAAAATPGARARVHGEGGHYALFAGDSTGVGLAAGFMARRQRPTTAR